MGSDLAFMPGDATFPTFPMGRYLPSAPAGMSLGWLKQQVSPGDWVLDPLGSTPQLPLELARTGYQVLTTCNNPILAFMLELLAEAPPRNEFLAALAELGAARRGEERLAHHFRNLYLTECAACRQMIETDAFLWKRGETRMYARLYHCPHCGDEGERPAVASDFERLTLPGNSNLYLARALERVALPGDPFREGAQDVAQFFLPRSLYFLTTLINRIEGLSLPESRRRLLTALALSVCDEANSLWNYPDVRSRPRQLTIPPVFRENNLWKCFQAGVDTWCIPGEPVPLTRWPALPAGNGICLFPGRLRGLLPLPIDFPLGAVMAVLPRPNQAFWTLSAVWSGWLWGRDAVTPLRNALERQRYDWHWHAQALHSIFSQLAHHLPAGVNIWTLMPELVPGFLSAAVLAGETAGLHLAGMALRADDELAQLVWKPNWPDSPQPSRQPQEKQIQIAIQEHLNRTAEPGLYLSLHAAGLAALAEQGGFPRSASVPGNEILTNLQNSIGRVFKTPRLLRHFERQPSQNIETGLWWLANPAAASGLTQADRVEMELVKWVLKNPGGTFLEIQLELNRLLPALQTPSLDLLKISLDSYAVQSQISPYGWQIRPSEIPSVRRSDLEAIARGMERLGKKLGYTTTGDVPLIWKTDDDKPAYLLFPMASAVISRYVLQPQVLPKERCILIVPGSRVNLILYKLKRDPRLAEAYSAGWRIMKFRQLRQVLDQPNLTISLFSSLLDGDPPRWEEATQLSIL